MEGLPIPRVDELSHALAQLTDGSRRVDHAARTGREYKVLRGHEGGPEVQRLLPHFALGGRQDSRRTDLDPRVEVSVLQGDADGLQTGAKQLEAFPVPGRQLSFAVHEAESLELFDAAVARGDRDPELPAQLKGRSRPRERTHEDSRRVPVHDRLAQLQRLHHLHSPFSPRILETRFVISSASNGLLT